MPRLAELVKLKEGNALTVFTSSDREFTAARRTGASGIISEAAAAIPEIVVSLDRAMQAGAPQAVERLESYLRAFVDATDALPPLVGIREACSLRGLKTGPPAGPLGAGSAIRCDEFRSWFRDWLPSALKESKGVSA